MPRSFTKDPDEVLDYEIDWTKWLSGDDTISTSSWTVPSGITKDSDSITDDTKSTKIWLSGGTDGTDYDLLNEIVTANGRTAQRTITIGVRSR